MLTVLSEMLNFTWILKKEPHNDWGLKPLHGTWEHQNATFSGLVGALVYHKAELIASTFIPLKEREYVMDWTISYAMRTKLLVFSQGQSSFKFMLYFKSFNSWVNI